MASEAGSGAGEKNMHDAEFTCKLFRFLQLLCEGHNSGERLYLIKKTVVTMKTVSVRLCIVTMLLCACVCERACVCACVRVYELTIVSMNKVLCFLKTL